MHIIVYKGTRPEIKNVSHFQDMTPENWECDGRDRNCETIKIILPRRGTSRDATLRDVYHARGCVPSGAATNHRRCNSAQFNFR